MQYFKPIASAKLDSQQLIGRGQQFLKARSPRAISQLLLCEENWLRDMAANPSYHSFSIPKASGNGSRLIENPQPKLKEWQRNLANFLQGVFWAMKPAAAYAFVPTVGDEPSPRNIYTNALRHCGSKWVLQLDLKDFFHQIKAPQIQQLFKEMPFDYGEELASLLARLTTFKGRLPMGAPTSPVLSNFAAIDLDTMLDRVARNLGWTYTRYADDLTFSATKKMSNEEVAHIRHTVEAQGFVLNDAKQTLSHIDERPEVCGLELRADRPDLSARFVKDLKMDIKTLRNVLSNKVLSEEIFPADSVQRFRQHVEGELAFVRFIKGPHHALYLKLRMMLAEEPVGFD